MHKCLLCFFSFFLLFSHTTYGATNPQSSTIITLERSVHFLTADGSDVVISPGTYLVESADEWLRLIPGERHDALLVEAEKSKHDKNITEPTAMGISGGDDAFLVTLLLPGGQSLEAIGTYSGIRSRAVKRGSTSSSLNRTRQKSRIPQQTPDTSLRVQKLENQVRTLQATINVLRSRLNKMESAIQVNSGNVTVNGTTVKIVSGTVDVRAALSKFSGVVKADTVNTNSVISQTYTPGAGNIW